MTSLFLVNIHTYEQWEYNHTGLAFTSLDREEAIREAHKIFNDSERSFMLDHDGGFVTVEETVIGYNHTQKRIWHSRHDLDYTTVGAIRRQTKGLKDCLALMWDDSLPSDVDSLRDYDYLPEQALVSVSLAESANDDNFLAFEKACAANDLQWHFFDKYEKNIA